MFSVLSYLSSSQDAVVPIWPSKRLYTSYQLGPVSTFSLVCLDTPLNVLSLPLYTPLPSSEVFLFLYPSFSSGTVCWWTASTGYVHLISDSLDTLVSWKRNLFIRRRTLLWRKVFMSVIRGWSFILFNFLSFNNIYLCFAYLLRIKSFSYHIYYLEIYINWLPLLTRVVPQ